MKKFCSKCGAQLDLGKKSCTSCQAFNPYFIAGFSASEDEVTVKKEQTINSPAIENPIEQKENTAELERLLQEQQKKNDSELKSQLLKVQVENEQFKQETFNLVKDVQKELHDIEKENKILKETVELLKTQPQVEHVNPVPAPPSTIKKPEEAKKGVTAIAAVALLIIVTVISYSFFSSAEKKTTIDSASNASPSVSSPSNVPDENKSVAPKNITADSAPKTKLLAAVSPPPAVPKTVVATKPANNTSLPATVTPQPARFTLTQSRLKEDLVGKKLSGCDITIKSIAEINSIDNLVLVDKLSASYLKYKCRVKINQGSDVFTSTPYIYYSAEGTFIKIDGTNCE